MHIDLHSVFSDASDALAGGICGIYVIQNNVTRQCYVGSSKDIRRRWAEHRRLLRNGRHTNKKLLRSWRANPDDGHSFIVVELASLDVLDLREGHWIAKVASFTDGLNLVQISEGRVRWSEDQRAERSRIAKRRWAENPLTDAQRKKRSDSAKRRAVSHPHTVAQKGKKFSDEHRKHMVEARTGVPLTPEHRKSLAAAQRIRFAANPVSKETRARQSVGIKRAHAKRKARLLEMVKAVQLSFDDFLK
jgi:group I intron endonuclease